MADSGVIPFRGRTGKSFDIVQMLRKQADAIENGTVDDGMPMGSTEHAMLLLVTPEGWRLLAMGRDASEYEQAGLLFDAARRILADR